MYQKQHHQQHVHCCILVHVSCFFWGGWDLALYCTYVPRVCRVIPCPILLVRTSYHTVFSCDNNSVFITLHSKQHRFFWWDVSIKATSSASAYTAVYICRVFFFFGWDVVALDVVALCRTHVPRMCRLTLCPIL